LLTSKKITAENYKRIMILIDNENVEIPKLEQSLSEMQAKIKDISETLTTFEKVAGGVYVKSLVDEHRQKLQAEYIPNGMKSADGDNSRLVNFAAKALGKKR